MGSRGARDVVCEQMRGQTAHELLSVPSRCDHWGGKAPLHGPRRTVQLRKEYTGWEWRMGGQEPVRAQ